MCMRLERSRIRELCLRDDLDRWCGGRFAEDEEVADLAEEAALDPGAADLLGGVVAAHGAADPTLGEEAGGQGGLIPQEGVVDVPVAAGEVLLRLSGQQKHEAGCGF